MILLFYYFNLIIAYIITIPTIIAIILIIIALAFPFCPAASGNSSGIPSLTCLSSNTVGCKLVSGDIGSSSIGVSSISGASSLTANGVTSGVISSSS